MNKKIFILGIIIVLAVIIGFITYKIFDKPQEDIGLNVTNQNTIEISEREEQNEDAITDECIDEWDDYNEYMSHRVEEASNNITEQDTHYLLKDIYGYIEIYYLDENNDEYLYKKTDISTDYLSQEDKEDLKVGIEVVGIEALNKMLEDFE